MLDLVCLCAAGIFLSLRPFENKGIKEKIEQAAIGQGETLLEVAADRFFLLDKNEILVFDGTGDYLTTIRSSEKIIDFSAYGDRVLDVLTEGAITEYDIKDGSH